MRITARHTGSDARSAIREVALQTFCRRGYRASTLAEIGAQVGLTRGTVLHHFSSKADLLAAVVDPFRTALDDLLRGLASDAPASARRQRAVLTGCAQLFLTHREELQLLANDVAAREQLGVLDPWTGLPQRFMFLLAGAAPTGVARLRVAIALGAMLHPIVNQWLAPDVTEADTRAELIDAAVAVMALAAPAEPPARVNRTAVVRI